MSLERAARAGMMARAIRETLGSFVAPELTEKVLAGALASGGLQAIPETAHEAAAFVNGPFRRTIARLVGDDTADAVVDGLRAVVEVASGFHAVPDGSGSQASNAAGSFPSPRSPSLELELTGLVPTGDPVVLVASLDRAGAEVVAERLRDRADVRIVSDTFEWLAGIETFGERRLVLVLDCCLPSVDPLAAGSLASMVPAHADVVVWGASTDVLEALYEMVGRSPNWHHVPVDATPPHLADYLLSGL